MTDTAQPHNPNERSASEHNAGERTLEERRAALKALMAAESTDVQEYHAVITGATEEERASLARTFTPKSVIGSDHINRTPLAAYVAGALVRTPDGDPWEYHRSAGRAMRTLLWEGRPDQQLIDAFLLGATERPEEWILRFIEGLPNSWARSKKIWETCYTLLRARNLSCDAPEYLVLFLHEALPCVKKDSASNHAQLKTFFTRDMTLLDQEFWAVFRTEGVLFKGYGNYMGESAELCRLMGEYFDIRDEILDALLRGLTSDFSAFNSAAFHSVYTDLQPTDAENRARFGQLMAVLTAEPSASVGFAQTMLQNVLKACAPAALQKTPDLQPLEQLDLEQLIDALGANLYRTEKKIQRGALRLLRLIATQYAGLSKAKRKKAQTAEQVALANYVADRVLEAYEVLPLELRGAAEACLPEDRLPQAEEEEAASTSIEVPPVLLPGVEHREPVASIANLEEFCTLITEESNTTSGRITGDESPSTRGENLARLYHFAATDKLAPAEQQQLRTLRKIADHYSYNNVAYMPALCAVLEANAEAAGYESWELPELTPLLQYSDRSEMVARARPSNALLSKEEMIRLTIQNKHHLWNADYKPLKGYRDLYEIFREQMRAVAAGGEYHTEGRTVRLLSAPLPARQLTYSDWTYRTVSALDIPWSVYYSGLNDSKVEEYRKASQAGEPTGEFVAADFVRHEPMWQVESDITDTVDEAREALSHATASMSPEETIAYEVLNTAFIPFTFLPNASESYGWQGDFMTALTEWASWLLQNNPDLLSAYFLFAASECVEEKTVTPVPVLMRALRESTVQVGAPTCTLLGYVASAKNPEYRLAAAEAIAALFEAGLLDASTFAETLKWALEDGMVLPNRLVATLREVSAISPLAGWRVLQVLRLLLPMVDGLTKGGDYVRLAVELAELYGTPVEIPAELEPKMKGSTVLAKSLRALAAVTPRVTEEALAARKAALTLLGGETSSGDSSGKGTSPAGAEG
ncbi:endonuclease [Rothia sp. (in: high G+C Gram-positive bacteria)]|uniref:endonuclease n=1 Tax=Rothia sp. (in: high G+C Gram-positive bacteria) TaxID=1885016 RepID=UPI0025DB7BE5|nr:endonuclease [Rothia sp. (in: high G+C Gram-positive bacteria)]